MKGRSLPTRIFEVVTRKADATDDDRARVALHKQGMEAFYRRDFAGAIELMQRVIALARPPARRTFDERSRALNAPAACHT